MENWLTNNQETILTPSMAHKQPHQAFRMLSTHAGVRLGSSFVSWQFFSKLPTAVHIVFFITPKMALFMPIMVISYAFAKALSKLNTPIPIGHIASTIGK